MNRTQHVIFFSASRLSGDFVQHFNNDLIAFCWLLTRNNTQKKGEPYQLSHNTLFFIITIISVKWMDHEIFARNWFSRLWTSNNSFCKHDFKRKFSPIFFFPVSFALFTDAYLTGLYILKEELFFAAEIMKNTSPLLGYEISHSG